MLCTREALQGEVLILPLKEQQSLLCEGPEGPWKLILEESGAVFMLQQVALQSGGPGSSLFSGSGIAQFVGPKKSHQPGFLRLLSAVTGVAMVYGEGRPPLLFWSYVFLWIDEQQKAWLADAVVLAKRSGTSPPLFPGLRSCSCPLCPGGRLRPEMLPLIRLWKQGRQQRGFQWTTLSVHLRYQPVLKPTPRFTVLQPGLQPCKAQLLERCPCT